MFLFFIIILFLTILLSLRTSAWVRTQRKAAEETTRNIERHDRLNRAKQQFKQSGEYTDFEEITDKMAEKTTDSDKNE